MHGLVRDLYKRFIAAGRDYPGGLNVIRQKVKEGFLKNKFVSDEVNLKKAIAKGRYHVREIIAVNQMHKYRHLKKKYYDADERDKLPR